ANCAGIDALDHQVANLVVGHHQLVDAGPAAEAALPARSAARAFPKADSTFLPLLFSDRKVVGQIDYGNLESGLTIGTNGANQPLGHDTFHGTADKERFNAHIDHTGKGARRVVGVERAEHQVAGERRLDGAFGGFQIAHFADEDNVGIVTQNASQ